METRSMAIKSKSVALAEVPASPAFACVPAVPEAYQRGATRPFTPPNEIDPDTLYYDDITPTQKARHRLSRGGRRSYSNDPSFDRNGNREEEYICSRLSEAHLSSFLSHVFSPRRVLAHSFLTPPDDN